MPTSYWQHDFSCSNTGNSWLYARELRSSCSPRSWRPVLATVLVPRARQLQPETSRTASPVLGSQPSCPTAIASMQLLLRPPESEPTLRAAGSRRGTGAAVVAAAAMVPKTCCACPRSCLSFLAQGRRELASSHPMPPPFSGSCSSINWAGVIFRQQLQSESLLLLLALAQVGREGSFPCHLLPGTRLVPIIAIHHRLKLFLGGETQATLCSVCTTQVWHGNHAASEVLI